jgi:hypothetical protein
VCNPSAALPVTRHPHRRRRKHQQLLPNDCTWASPAQEQPRLTTMTQKPFTSSVPEFDDLPKADGMPQGCAWGVFDRDGAKDVLGTLNFLTPDIVLNASSEIKEGHSISLKYVWGSYSTSFHSSDKHHPRLTLLPAAGPSTG